MNDRGQQPANGLPTAERSRWWGLRFRVRERLGRSLIVVPCLYIVAALGLAELVSAIEGSSDLLGLALDADTARTILSAVAGGMIAFTGLVVSIAVVVVQFGASQYTPRLVNRFRRDPQVKHSLGVFIAPAIFALVSLRVIGEDGSASVPSLTVTLSIALLVAAVVAFFLLVAGLLDLLRPRSVIATVVAHADAAIRDTYPLATDDSHLESGLDRLPVDTVIRHEGPPRVLSALDRGRLVRAASAAGCVVEVAAPVGAHVRPGAALFVARGARSPVSERELRRSAILADERTIAQDPAFAIRAIADLALRALSPAVNDPTTAVQALDGLESLLTELARRDLGASGAIADDAGELRLIYPTPGWDALLDLSLTEIRNFGLSSPQIPRRMRALLDNLLEHTPPARHPALRAQLARLDTAIEREYDDPVERAHARQADRLGIGTTAPLAV